MLVAEFCIRLACGLACMMLGTSTRAVGASFFQPLMLTVLGLSVTAALFGSEGGPMALLCLIASAVLASVGFVVWALGRVAAAPWTAALLFAALAAALVRFSLPLGHAVDGAAFFRIASAAASALLLGSMTAAMLLGHSYLVAPTMSMDPLKRLVVLVAASVAVRTLLAGGGLLMLTLGAGGESGPRSLDEFGWSLLAARWLIGLLGPGVVTWMVWQTVKIRSTQSATGILYAGVFFVFLGEVAARILAARLEFAA